MAFGRGKSADNEDKDDGDAVTGPESTAADVDDGDLDGPFDIEDFDDPEVAAVGRLDLGSVLIPLPEAGQVQVELNETGVPSAVWWSRPTGVSPSRPCRPEERRAVARGGHRAADSLRKDAAKVSIETGPWGREVVGAASGAVRFIGIDGYRWMIRCVVNGTHETAAALAEARTPCGTPWFRRGDTPLPVRTPLPVQLPEPMAAQRQAAAEQAAAAQAQQAGAQPPEPPEPPTPAARRSVPAMQQFRGMNTITGG